MYTLPHTSSNTDSFMSDSSWLLEGIEVSTEVCVSVNTIDFRSISLESLIKGIKSLF